MSIYSKKLLDQLKQLSMTASAGEPREERLARIRRIMAHLGNPQSQLNTIHITGTSGKGSVAALLQSLLSAYNLRVGTLSSPHLQTPLERIQIDGRLIAPEIFEQAATGALTANELSRYVEGWFVTGMLALQLAHCDCAIVEVGTGGRYSTTNVVEPTVTVVNSIGYDHQGLLGNTLEEIAWHKAGIMKPDIPCVVGDVPPEAMEVVVEEAQQSGALLTTLGQTVAYQVRDMQDGKPTIDYQGRWLSVEGISCGLLGKFQAGNAATALAAFEHYAEATGLMPDDALTRKGLDSAQFAGRLEIIDTKPMVVLDGAHNEQKLHAVLDTIDDLTSYNNLIVVFGLMESKQVGNALQRIAEQASLIITTEQHTAHLRAFSAEALAERFPARAVPVREPRDAVAQALTSAGPKDLVLVTGSLYLVGAVRERWFPTNLIETQRTLWPE